MGNFSACGHLAYGKSTHEQCGGTLSSPVTGSQETPWLISGHQSSETNNSAAPCQIRHWRLPGQTFRFTAREDYDPQFPEMQTQKSALTFETTDGSTNLSANRKQTPVKREATKCLWNSVSKCLSHCLRQPQPYNVSS